MANVDGTFYSGETQKPNTNPVSPPYAVDDPIYPVNPPGSGTSSDFVPYEGASRDVDLGANSLLAESITLNPAPATIPTAQGSLYFDADEETIAAILNGTTQKIGEDSFIQVKNQSGVTIPKGTAVRFNGVLGASGRVIVVPFLADGTYPSMYFVGITSEEILNGGDGKAYNGGKVRGIDTNAYTIGTILYCSTTVAGGFQSTAPIAPNNIISVAAVIAQSATVGALLVRPQIGSNINTDEGVKIVGVQNGDILKYNESTGLFENTPETGSTKDGLISGGLVQWTGTGFVFNVSRALARFSQIELDSLVSNQVTLAASHATLNRRDIFILQVGFDGAGTPISITPDKITGTAAASPVKPQINPLTQIELTDILVIAASTTPTLTTEVIYDENVEWVGSYTGTGTVVFNSAANPFQGPFSIEATNIENGLKIRLTRGSDFDVSTVQTLGKQLDLKAQMFAGQNIGVTFLNSAGSAISTELILNFDKSSTIYQFIGEALNQFTFTSFLARSIEFRYIRTKGAIIYSGFYLDIIKLEGGINPPVTPTDHNSLQSIQGGNATERYHTTKDQNDAIVGAATPSAANVFATMADVGGGGITGSGTVNEIAYFTAPTAIASLPVATYPSLTEFSYMKGVTSPVQTQINGKQATIAGALTDTYVATIVAGVPTWAAPSGGGGSNWTVLGSDIYRNSRVLIGATTFIDTTATLEISGRVSQVGLGGSTFFGLNAGKVDDLTSNNNTGFGNSALNSATTGSGNCAFGVSALLLNVSGSDNVAIGRSALQNNLNSNNVAIGPQSMQLNTSGNSNTAIGFQSLNNNLSGLQNTALGGRSLSGNTSSYNTAIGFDACYLNSSGTDNTAVGHAALRANSTSSLNTAVGSAAAYSITGAQNTVIGTASMYSSTTGANNSTLGYHAGRYITGGATANVLCNNSVFIGHSTRANTNNETNQIVIGYNATGAGSNTATLGNTSIIKTILRGTVNMAGLPTSSAGLVTGDVWNNAGVLNIV